MLPGRSASASGPFPGYFTMFVISNWPAPAPPTQTTSPTLPVTALALTWTVLPTPGATQAAAAVTTLVRE